jgi:hypothetical protein
MVFSGVTDENEICSAQARIENFGGNIQFSPQQIYAPRTEADVLEILNYHGGGKRSARWPGCTPGATFILADNVLVAMHNFNQLSIEEDPTGSVIATVGAGLTLKELLPALRAEAGVTLPTLPGTLVQTLAGCISTATHGSGTPSLSHYVVGVRMAAYDPNTGEAAIYEWNQTVPSCARRAVQWVSWASSCRSRSAACPTSRSCKRSSAARRSTKCSRRKIIPLQEFVLIPYAWKFIAVRRRPLRKRPGVENSFKARLYRFYSRVGSRLAGACRAEAVPGLQKSWPSSLDDLKNIVPRAVFAWARSGRQQCQQPDSPARAVPACGNGIIRPGQPPARCRIPDPRAAAGLCRASGRRSARKQPSA